MVWSRAIRSQASAWTTEWNSQLWKWEGCRCALLARSRRRFHWPFLLLWIVTEFSGEVTSGGKAQDPFVEETQGSPGRSTGWRYAYSQLWHLFTHFIPHSPVDTQWFFQVWIQIVSEIYNRSAVYYFYPLQQSKMRGLRLPPGKVFWMVGFRLGSIRM